VVLTELEKCRNSRRRLKAGGWQAEACPIYESAGSVKAFRWDFLGFVRPFEHTFTSG
jgi:hypothetical protein